MPKLIVTAKEFRYAGRSMAAGETFDASDKDARLIKATGKAADAPGDLPAPPKPPITRAPRMRFPQPPITPAQEAAKGAEQSNIYERRDMRAKDE
jgi:hypothetical protein